MQKLHKTKTKKSDKEIEDLALEFAKAESYGEFSTDLWKGFVFGFKKAVKLLKPKEDE